MGNIRGMLVILNSICLRWTMSSSNANPWCTGLSLPRDVYSSRSRSFQWWSTGHAQICLINYPEIGMWSNVRKWCHQNTGNTHNVHSHYITHYWNSFSLALLLGVQEVALYSCHNHTHLFWTFDYYLLTVILASKSRECFRWSRKQKIYIFWGAIIDCINMDGSVCDVTHWFTHTYFEGVDWPF